MSLRLLPGVTRIWRLVMGLFEDTKVGFISYETTLLVRHEPPYYAYSGLPLNPSDLGYSPGQPVPVITGPYRAQITKLRPY